eukprot:SAG31_NODE_1055_length_10134_cov_14.461837_3_plen_216_part_00
MRDFNREKYGTSSPETDLIKAHWVSAKSEWSDKIRTDPWWATLHARAAAGGLDGWARSPWEALALVLLLDQVPRCLFDGAAAFVSDDRALAATLAAIERGDDLVLPPAWRVFFYFPLMHAENVLDQELAVAKITALAAAAPGFTVLVKSAAAHLEPVQVRSYFLVFVPLLEKYGTFIARCNALIEKVSPCISYSAGSRSETRCSAGRAARPRRST